MQATQNTLQFGDKCKGISRNVTNNKKQLTAAELEVWACHCWRW